MEELEFIAQDIKDKAGEPQLSTAQKLMSEKQVSDSTQNFFDQPADNGFSFRTYDVGIDQAYTQLNDGSYVSKFDNFIAGTNNENRLAQQQSSGSKWGNGMLKLLGKTVTAAVGGTIGTVNGIINGISEGSFEATYNNDFNGWLDDLNTKMDYKLPNYYTEQEKSMGLSESIGTANFWANDVTSGLSFTLGTIVSEGIWAAATGGAGNVAKWGAKALSIDRSLAGINTFKSIAGKSILRGTEKTAVDQVQKAAMRQFKVGKLAENARFMITSAGYEAGVEARHYMKSTKENWLNSFQELNGRPPTQQEVTNFNNELTDVANRVFVANVGLVGASNVAMFGRILKGSPINQTVKNSTFKNKVLGVGYNVVDGKKVAIKATKAQRVARGAYTFGKYGLLEGVVEEGGQGVISSAGENFMLDTYNPDNIDNTVDLMDSVIKGFEESYGTKEGQKAIGIGFIIGLFGGGIATKVRFNDLGNEQKEVENLVNKSNKVTSELFFNRIKEISRIENLAKQESDAQVKGDITGEATARRAAMQIRAMRDIRLGGVEEGIADLEAYLNKTTSEEIAKSTGITDIDAQAQYKQDVLREYTDVAEKTQRNLNFAEAILGETPIAGASQYNLKDLAEGMAYDLTMGEVSDEIADGMVNTIKESVAASLGLETTDALTVENALRKVEPKYLEQIDKLGKKLRLKRQREQNITNRIFNLQNTSKEDNQNYTQELSKANKQLLEIQREIQDIEVNRELALNTSNIPTLSEGQVTLDMIDNQKESLKLLKDKINSLPPIEKQNVQTLIKNYEAAVRQTKQYNKAVQLITDPTIRAVRMKGWLSKLINKNKKLDERLDKYFKESTETAKALELSQEGAIAGPPTVKKEEGDAVSEAVDDAQNDVRNIDKLNQEIEEIVEKDSFLKEYVGDETETELDKKDTDRFSELLKKVSIDPQTVISTEFEKGRGLNEEETQELKDLNSKLNDWRVIDGSGIGDKLKLIEALETEVENDNTQPQTNVSDIVMATQPEGTEGGLTNVNTVQSPSIKLAKYVAERGIYEISHTDIGSLLDIVPNSSLTLNGKDISEVNEKKRKKAGNKFILKTPEAEITVTVADHSRIEVKKDELDSVLPEGTYFVDLGLPQFFPLYIDGRPAEGDFGYEKVNGETVDYNENATNDLGKGDVLIAEIDLNDSYNKDLLGEYNKGKITKQDLANKLHIYLKPKNLPSTVVGSLRAIQDSHKPSPSVNSLSQLRNEAVDKVLNRETDNIDLGMDIPVDKILLGNPNVNIENGRPSTIPFTSESSGQVLATGYILDGEVKLNKKVETNSKIARGISKKNKGRKIPVVVFRYGKQTVTYPVNLVETKVDLSEGADQILSTTLDAAQKAEKFVKYLQSNKIDPNSFGIDYSLPNWMDTQATQSALDFLSEKINVPDIETWLSPDFSPTNLVEQAQISVDITDRPLLSSKVIIKLEERRPYDNRLAKQLYKNKLEQDRINLVENLSQETIHLERLFQDSTELSNKDVDSEFLTAMYDKDVQKTPDTYIKNAQNVSILTAMFENNIPRKVAARIGKEKIDSIRQRLVQLEKLRDKERNTPRTVEELTDQEINELGMALSNTPFESTDELLPELMKGFYNNGVFNPSISSLTSTRLYDSFEAKELMGNLDKLEEIKELILKLQTTDKDVQRNFYNDDRFASISSEQDILGKLKTENPYLNEKKALELLGGIKDRDSFEEVLYNSDMEFLKESYEATRGSERDLFVKFAKYDRVPNKVIIDGNIVDRPNTNRGYLEEVLTEPTSDDLITTTNFLLDLSPTVADINKERVQKVVDETLDNMVDIGIDMSEHKGKSLEELRPLLQTVSDYITFQDQLSFDNLVVEYDKVNPPVDNSTEIVNLPVDIDTNYVIYLNTEASEYRLYEDHNIVRIDDNVYLYTGEQSLEEMYQELFKFEEKGTDFQEFKNRIAKEANKVERFDTEIYEPEVMEKITVTKKFFNLPIVHTANINNISSRATLYRDEIRNIDYLTTTFIADFNKQRIEEKRKDSDKYHNYLSKFEITKNGITFVSNDPITVEQVRPYLTDNMEKYLRITGQLQSEQYDGIISRDIKRTYYLENPKSLPIFDGNYNSINDSTIMSKKSSDFIRTPDNRIWEQTASIGQYSFYSQLSQPVNKFKLNTTKPDLNINLEDYRYLEQPDASVQTTNFYTKAVEEEIDKELDCD